MADVHIPYIIPTLALSAALALRLPTLWRAGRRDPDVRATVLLLLWAAAVLVVITPVNIDRLNRWTGIANFSAPWAYSFLTAFCGTALTMIIRWSEPPSERRRRRMITIYWIYAGIIAGLWVTFLLADVPEPRIYDLDTYYASTPWMREHVLLYVLAHAASALVAASMLWRWFPEVNRGWIKSGVVCLQAGWALALGFDIAKLTAVIARWSGHNLDVLSTKVAPPFAMMEAMLVAIGFTIPQAGPALQTRLRNGREYRRLANLWRTVRVTRSSAANARFGVLTPFDLKLMQREQRIHDALRVLAPYFDHDAYRHHYARISAEHGETRQARGLAGALAVQQAVQAFTEQKPLNATDQPLLIGPEVTNHLDAIGEALHRPHLLDRLVHGGRPVQRA
ncbi:MAB_1171c family putative transporter [Streptomyces sp. VN1]|uniref:MAB_1171c family putative transporter n=1 Tax=Streptomyces sp. VN1 TaxID=1821625 RepID=UPI001E3336B1|nr:MAB_1171c family putative transporter [Streptomyces sp. VN1]